MSKSRPSPADPSLDIVAGVEDDLLDDRDGFGLRAEELGEPGPKNGPEMAGFDDGTDGPEMAGFDDGTDEPGKARHELDEPAEPEPAEPDEAEPGFVRNLLEWAAILGGALVVALVVTKFLVQAFFIPSGSMLPTLNLDDRVLVNKLSYDLHEVNRGDLVVFERPASEGDSDIKDLIKRVVALSGETVESREGRLFVNGEPLDEPYLPSGVETSGVDLQTIPPGHIFVMGDNRGDSRDSRFFGPLPEELVIGRAFVKVWPLLDFGLL